MPTPQQMNNPMMGMFGNQPSMYPAMMNNMPPTQGMPAMGNVGQQRSSEYTPIEGQPGYFTNPDNYRYKKKGPNYYQPADPMPQPQPNEFRLPDPFYQKPHLKEDPQYAPLVPLFWDLPGVDPYEGPGANPYLYRERLPGTLGTGTIGSGIEENYELGIDYAQLFGLEIPGIPKELVGWLDTEQGQMFLDLYQQALDEK